MNAVTHAEFDVVEGAATFFAPTSTDLLDPLLGAWAQARQRIADVAAYVAGEAPQQVLHYFLDGNATEDRGRGALSASVQQLFDEAGAVAALNAAYWSKALALTDVLDLMPQKRRDEWHEQIRNPRGREDWVYEDGRKVKKWIIEPLPDFTPEAARPTLLGLLAMRQKFFAERVDGVFRALSPGHVTNAPEGFGRRMILSGVLSDWGLINHSRAGVIGDLRKVVARFMGRDEPHWRSTDAIIKICRARRGEWVSIDGGALRMRVYKVGTAHLEVHPDIAWRLNQVLAHLHPAAIPAEFRTQPKRAPKSWPMMARPLPNAVLSMLGSMRRVHALAGKGGEIRNARSWDFGEHDKAVRRAAEQVLQALGAAPVEHYWQFDYDPTDVLAEVVASGCIPDKQAHQFYPTPETVAAAAVQLADVGPEHTVLEPSAGQGGLADLLPTKGRVLCVEIASLHAQILSAKGYQVEHADFLAWAQDNPERFDRVIMNPPFSEGRAKLHTEAAAGLLQPGGVLVAVLPASFRGKDWLPGGDTTWSGVFAGEFAGTSVDVVLMRFQRAA